MLVVSGGRLKTEYLRIEDDVGVTTSGRDAATDRPGRPERRVVYAELLTA
jgi:hypothetical protein